MAPYTASRHKRWQENNPFSLVCLHCDYPGLLFSKVFCLLYPQPWHCPPRTSGEAHRRGSWREQAWSITSLAKRTCLCHQEEQGAWAQSAIPGAVSYQAGSDLRRTDRMTERTRAVEDVSVLESQKG